MKDAAWNYFASQNPICPLLFGFTTPKLILLMAIFQFFGLLVLTGFFHLISFMGVAFAFAGIEPYGSPAFTAKILEFFVGLGDILLKAHLFFAPLYYAVTIGVFLFGSRAVANHLAKWSFALPVASFVIIFLFFFIMSRLSK